MERQHTGQEENLVKVDMGPDAFPRPGASHAKCRATCMVALTALALVTLTGLILYQSFFTPRCLQEVQPSHEGSKVILTSSLQGVEGQGTYDIFTINKAANYLVYGWVKLTNVTDEKITLEQTLRGDKVTLKAMEVKKDEVFSFFFTHRLLADKSTIRIHFRSSYEDSLFHLYEL